MKTTIAVNLKASKICSKYAQVKTAISHCNGNNDLISVVTKKYERKIKREQKELSVKEFCNRLIIKKLDEIAYALPSPGYSMGTYYKVFLKSGNDKTICTGTYNNAQEYSHSSNYRANHGSVDLSLSMNEYLNISVIGGLITYIAPQKAKVKKCWWYASIGQKQHYHLVKKEGYIFLGFHHETKEGALSGGNRIQQNEKEKQDRILREAKEKSAFQKKYNKALKSSFSFADSLAAGNCEAGTQAFCIRLNLNPGKEYTGKFLLKLAAVKSSTSVSYIERMINYKASKL